jgi:copper chaperone CopZ
MKTLILDVGGMTCNHCADSIARALTGTTGVEDAMVDVMAGTVRVSIDEKRCGTPQLIEAVQQAGYQVNAYKSAD